MLAEALVESVQWSDAIQAADHPKIYSVVNKDTGEMGGGIWPYNEYYLVNLKTIKNGPTQIFSEIKVIAEIRRKKLTPPHTPFKLFFS